MNDFYGMSTAEAEMNDHLLESSMGSAQDFTPGQLMIRERSLWTWLLAWSEPKLRADLDAPVGNDEQTGTVEAVHTVDALASALSPFAAGAGSACCPACADTGVRSYHELPGPYGVEPCGECEE